MSGKYDSFAKKFRLKELLLHESNYWIWSLRPVQSTLGAGILSLKRYAESFSDINVEEGLELSEIVKIIERKLREAFVYDRINYLMLMMVDPHLHFHIIPRYSDTVEFENIQWFDEGWPGLPILDSGVTNDTILYKVKAYLQTK